MKKVERDLESLARKADAAAADAAARAAALARRVAAIEESGGGGAAAAAAEAPLSSIAKVPVSSPSTRHCGAREKTDTVSRIRFNAAAEEIERALKDVHNALRVKLAETGAARKRRAA